MQLEHHTALRLTAIAAAAIAASTVLSACGGSSESAENKNTRPSYLGVVASATYDGNTNDLLTAGLGKTGLGATAPTAVDPLNPTPAELRKGMEDALRSKKPTLINAVIDETAGTESGRITSLNPTAGKKK